MRAVRCYLIMRSQPTSPAALTRQLAEWRQPIDADPAVDDAVVRMLRSLDRYLQRPQTPQESKT
jgi:hypothetical protein